MKKIIILSDGTGNGAAKRHGTNVRRLYDALDLHQPDQDAFYDDGVGSQEFLPLKLLGGVFGWGLKRNVLEMYKFLCQAYRDAAQDGDPDRQIYLFGFSRGAFTVRVLAALIDYCGLCTGFKDEQELAKVARDNYRAFRSRYEHGLLYQLFRKLTGASGKAQADQHPGIEFIGVWDTVDAYGLPVDELAILWDRLIYPIRFPDRQLCKTVKRACHAISVDDERLTFHPLLWNEKNEDKRIEQVWFPGVHSDVGGGYPESELALLSLDWMMSKVTANPANPNGLHFIQGAHQQIAAHSDWYGMQHDSRSGLAAYYRYKPRNIEQLCNDPDGGVVIQKPKIHRSVFERIKAGFNGYAPTGLPKDYEAVTTQGLPPVFESASESHDRHVAINGALDVIFWRRWLYGALVVATFMLVASRFFLDFEAGGVCDGSACLIDPLLAAMQSFLPDMLGGWFEVLRQHAMWLWGFLILFLVLFKLKAKLLTATRSRAEAAWSALTQKTAPTRWQPTNTFKFRSAAHSKFRNLAKWLLATVVFLVILGLIAMGIDRSVMHIRGILGGMCEGRTPSGLSVEQSATIDFDIANPCAASGIQLEKGGRYRITVHASEWYDGSLEASPDQMKEAPFRLVLFVPLRRHIGEPWMRLMGRIGADGNDTFAVGKGLDELQAKSTGELFFYANDAVFGLLPGDKWSLPYTWEAGRNQGTAQIIVTRLE